MPFSTSLDAIQAGDRVRFVVHLINDGDEPAGVPQGQRDNVEVSVRRNEGELWRWTAGINRGSHGQTIIPPGDRVRWFCEWPEPSYGTYTAVATITIDESAHEATAPVTVTKGVAEAAPSGPEERSRTPGTSGPASREPSTRPQPESERDEPG